MKKLEDEGHDPSDWKEACEKAMAWGDEIYIGLFLENDRLSLDSLEPVIADGVPLAHRHLGLSSEQAKKLIRPDDVGGAGLSERLPTVFEQDDRLAHWGFRVVYTGALDRHPE